MGDSGVLVQNPLQAMMGVDGGKAMGGKEVPSSKPKAVLESAKSMTGKLVEKIDLTKTTILDAKSDLSQMHVPKPNAHGQSMVSERVKERQDAKSGKRPLTRSLSSRKAFREQHLSSHVALDLSLVMMGIHGILTLVIVCCGIAPWFVETDTDWWKPVWLFIWGWPLVGLFWSAANRPERAEVYVNRMVVRMMVGGKLIIPFDEIQEVRLLGNAICFMGLLCEGRLPEIYPVMAHNGVYIKSRFCVGGIVMNLDDTTEFCKALREAIGADNTTDNDSGGFTVGEKQEGSSAQMDRIEEGDVEEDEAEQEEEDSPREDGSRD